MDRAERMTYTLEFNLTLPVDECRLHKVRGADHEVIVLGEERSGGDAG
jgi:hypothetical protein